MRAALPRRHRRVLAGVGATAALVVGLAAWSAATRDEPGVTTAPPRPTTSAEPAAGVPRHLRTWLVPGSPLPEPRDGVTVLDRADGPVADLESVGLSLTDGPDARWVLAVVRDDGELVVYSDYPTISRWLRFDYWLTDLALQEEGGTGLELASVGDDGRMTPVADGAVVLDQAVDRDHRMGAFRERGDSVFAVALVRWDGHRWFVMSERYDGESRSTVIAASRSETTATTAEEFIAQYSELGKRP